MILSVCVCASHVQPCLPICGIICNKGFHSLWFVQQCCQRFKSSGMWFCVMVQVVLIIIKAL